jgi:large subunit ribosomal protein L32
MPLPKRKISAARRDNRRNQNWKLKLPSVSTCPRCDSPRLSHTTCPSCGFYNGRKVLETRAEQRRNRPQDTEETTDQQPPSARDAMPEG